MEVPSGKVGTSAGLSVELVHWMQEKGFVLFLKNFTNQKIISYLYTSYKITNKTELTDAIICVNNNF